MILGSNGIKMGKRFPEFVVNPSDVVRDYGADTLRLYEMFMGPLEVSKPWSDSGVEGARKFINRVWNFMTNEENIVENTTSAESGIRDTDMAQEVVRLSNFNILEQAGYTMMAQANQNNQGVLSLLQ